MKFFDKLHLALVLGLKADLKTGPHWDRNVAKQICSQIRYRRADHLVTRSDRRQAQLA
jgi:hypothetical protein